MEKQISIDPSIMVIGFGNPGREDDGAGVAVAGMLEEQHLENVEVICDYQLNVEDALEIKDKDAVIFVDASVADIDSFRFTEVTAETAIDFSTHSISPGGVLGLCKQLYGTLPRAWLLEIKGSSWGMREGISDAGKRNCEKAFAWLKGAIAKIRAGDCVVATGAQPEGKN